MTSTSVMLAERLLFLPGMSHITEVFVLSLVFHGACVLQAGGRKDGSPLADTRAGTDNGGAATSGGSAPDSPTTSGDGATGSSGNTGTTGSADTPPPFVPGTCNGLGKVGQWEEITPPGITETVPYTGAMMGIVDPNNPGTVYSTTSMNGIFKSTDCGASWEKLNTGRNGDQLDKGEIWSAVLDPVSPSTLYALTGYGPSGLWKSTDGGVDWDNILPSGQGMPGFVARVDMDPTNHLHILINFHDNCTAGHTPVCFGESEDGGANWIVKDFPTKFASGWGEGTFLLPLDATHWLFEDWDLYYSGDAGQNWEKVDTGGVAAIQGPYFKAPDGSYWLTSAQGVLTSTDGEHWTHVPNSFGGMDAIVGCGNRLFSIVGFQPPSGENFAYTATYDAPMTWTALDTPGLAKPVKAGANSVVCDSYHNIVYTSALAAGFWRMVTDGATATSGGASGGGD